MVGCLCFAEVDCAPFARGKKKKEKKGKEKKKKRKKRKKKEKKDPRLEPHRYPRLVNIKNPDPSRDPRLFSHPREGRSRGVFGATLKSRRASPAVLNLATTAKKCSGSFISFLDVDDWWVPEKLELQINYFKNEDDIGLVYSKYLIYNQKTKNKKLVANNNLPEGYITEHLLEEYKIGILTVMIKRELLDEFNVYFNPEYNIIGDFDFNIKLSKQVKFGCIQKPLAFYRLHGENLSLKNLNEEIKELEHWAKNQFISDKKNTKVSNKMNNLILYKKIYLNISENKRFTALKKIFTYPNNFLKVKLIILLFTPLFMLKRFNVLG